MRKLNKPLLRRLARKLRRLRHEEHYEQANLAVQTRCGTAACIAGHTVIESGYAVDFIPYDSPVRDDALAFASKCSKGKRSFKIWNKATELLGLTKEQSETLFSASPEARWPIEYAARWASAKPRSAAPQRRSRIAADLLDGLADGTVKL